MYYYNGIRTTDWIPVGYRPDEVFFRSVESDFEEEEYHLARDDASSVCSEEDYDCDFLTKEEYELAKGFDASESEDDECIIAKGREVWKSPGGILNSDMGCL